MTEQEAQQQVEAYRQTVMAYEATQAKILALLRGKKGAEELSADEYQQYRALARERDALQSEMRYYEQQLLSDE